MASEDYEPSLDFLKVRELADVPSIPQLHTRWYSPLSLDFMSLRRSSAQTPPLSSRPFFLKDEERRVGEYAIDEEALGTIFVHPDEVGRRALRPQPSWDPDDPLNWNNWQKYKTYLTICVFAFLATANASKFTVGLMEISNAVTISVIEIRFLTAFNVLALGFGNLVLVPLGRITGKRPIFLIAPLLVVAANIWASETHQYVQLLASSVLSGFGASPALGFAPSVMIDLFYVHQRAAALMWFQISISCGLFLGTLINGLVVQYFSWRINCLWITIATGLAWVLAIYTVQETTYVGRDVMKPIHAYGSKKTHLQRLDVTSGWNKDQSLLLALRDLLSIIAYPGILWLAIISGLFAAWNILIRLSLIAQFSTPPHPHSTQFLALTSLAPLTGSLLAFLPFGKGIDALSSYLSRKRDSIREPEYRLYLLLIPILLGTLSLILVGFTLHGRGTDEWIAPIIGWGIHSFAMTAVENMVLVYAVDCFAAWAGEIGACVAVARGVGECVVVIWGEEWIDGRVGGVVGWGIMAGVQGAIGLLGLGFWVWGKRVRLWCGKWGVVRWERRV